MGTLGRERSTIFSTAALCSGTEAVLYRGLVNMAYKTTHVRISTACNRCGGIAMGYIPILDKSTETTNLSLMSRNNTALHIAFSGGLILHSHKAARVYGSVHIGVNYIALRGGYIVATCRIGSQLAGKTAGAAGGFMTVLFG